MRILFFTDHFKPEATAPAAHVFERCQLWVKWGYQVTVICAAPNFPEGKLFPGYKNSWRATEAMDGIRVVRVKTFIHPNEGFLWRVLDYFSYLISSFFFAFFEPKPDVVLSTSPHMFVPVAGVMYGICRKIPHVFEVRDLWPAAILATRSMRPGIVFRILERLEMFMYRHSAGVIAFTHSFKREIVRRGISPDKIQVVINGANLELFVPRPKDSEITKRHRLQGKTVIGYLGTHGLCHGLENAIYAAHCVQDPEVVFLFVGAGADKQNLEKLARKLELTNVIFVPQQLKEEMPRYWSVCDFSLIHLRDDPLFKTVIPSKIFESMAMSVPILFVGPEGEGACIVRNQECGLVIPPDNPRVLANEIERLAKTPEVYRKWGQEGLSSARKFSRANQAQSCVSFLVRVIKEWPGRHHETEPDKRVR